MAIQNQSGTDNIADQNGFGSANDEIAANVPGEIGFVFSNGKIA